jgi:hypothetical protein
MNADTGDDVIELMPDATAASSAEPEPSLLDNEVQQRAERWVREQFGGVLIGRVASMGELGGLQVEFPGNPTHRPVAAQTTVSLESDAVGREVVLLFEGGNPFKPIIVGVLQTPEPLTAQVKGKRVVIAADQEIVLSCGKASITLTRAGKILIRGAYLLSRSSGVNRIKGGSVQIN